MLRRAFFLLVLLLVGCQQSQPVTPLEPTPKPTNPTLDNPSNFTGISLAPDTVELSWTAPSGVSGYWLERAKDSGDFESLIELGQVSSFRDSSVLPNTTYRYRLFAYSNNSTRSSGVEVSVTTLPSNIPDTTYIQGDARSATTIELQWLEVFSATAYKIERKTETGNFLEIASLPASTRTFKDTGLTPDTAYTYRVRTETFQGLSVGAEIERRTYDTKTWRTLVEVQRDPNITPAFVTPILDKGAIIREYGPTTLIEGRYHTDLYLSFVDQDGRWGTSNRTDIPAAVSPFFVSNNQSTVVAAWHNWNKLYVKRYSEPGGWNATEEISLPDDTTSVEWSRVSLANDGTVHLIWQQDQYLWASSSSGGVWSPRHLLESETGNEGISWYDNPRLLTGSNGATFAIWTTMVGDRESYKLRVSRRVGDTWTPAETLVDEEHFFIKYDLNIQANGSATLVWANGPTYALQFTPGIGWSERKVLSNGYYGNRYEQIAGNDKGVVAVIWREDFTLYATVYTPELGWNHSQVIMDNLSFGSNKLKAVLVTPEGEIFVIAARGEGCSILSVVRYKAISGWSEPSKINGDQCISNYDPNIIWLNNGHDPMLILSNRWMSKFE